MIDPAALFLDGDGRLDYHGMPRRLVDGLLLMMT